MNDNLTNAEIVKILISAKQLYLDRFEGRTKYYSLSGMCWTLYKVIYLYTGEEIEYSKIEDYIDKFTPKNFGASTYGSYWWPLDDKESRIKAFDNLINHYKNIES